MSKAETISTNVILFALGGTLGAIALSVQTAHASKHDAQEQIAAAHTSIKSAAKEDGLKIIAPASFTGVPSPVRDGIMTNPELTAAGELRAPTVEAENPLNRGWVEVDLGKCALYDVTVSKRFKVHWRAIRG
jgi:hypothetical protein